MLLLHCTRVLVFSITNAISKLSNLSTGDVEKREREREREVDFKVVQNVDILQNTLNSWEHAVVTTTKV